MQGEVALWKDLEAVELDLAFEECGTQKSKQGDISVVGNDSMNRDLDLMLDTECSCEGMLGST